LGAAPLKVPFPILIRTTLTTVPHNRADCDTHNTTVSRFLIGSSIYSILWS